MARLNAGSTAAAGTGADVFCSAPRHEATAAATHRMSAKRCVTTEILVSFVSFVADPSCSSWPEQIVRKSSGTCPLVLDYNPPVIRRLTAAALVVLVQASAICAPLLHVHLDADETDHHHGQALHAHLSGHDNHDTVSPHRPGPIVDHQEEAGRTVAAQIFVSAAADSFSLPAVPPSAFVLVVPPEQLTGRTPHTAHATDPPSLRIASPRAPPASLS
jgi:hypothetical protein